MAKPVWFFVETTFAAPHKCVNAKQNTQPSPQLQKGVEQQSSKVRLDTLDYLHFTYFLPKLMKALGRTQTARTTEHAKNKKETMS